MPGSSFRCWTSWRSSISTSSCSALTGGLGSGKPGGELRNILDLLPHKEITHIPSNIHAIQNQVLGLIQKALDMDERKSSLDKNAGGLLRPGGSVTR